MNWPRSPVADRTISDGLELVLRDVAPSDTPVPVWRRLWQLYNWLFRWCGFTIPSLGLTLHVVVPGNRWPAALMVAYTVGLIAAVVLAEAYRRRRLTSTESAVRCLLALSLWLGVVLGLMMRPALQSSDPERVALLCLMFATVSAGVNSLVTATVPRAYLAFVGVAQVMYVVQFLVQGGRYFHLLALGTVVVSISMAIVARHFQRLLHEALERRIEQAETSERLREALARLDEMVATDDLTGLANRRRFLDLLEAHIRDTEHSPACVILFDIDNFKQVNDTYGHAVGDQVLRRVAEVARSVLRAHDTIGRVGGEEFAIVCRARSEQTAAVVAERLRSAIARLSDHGVPTPVTASFGVAQVLPGASPNEALAHADVPLYRAKANGRNRVELAGFAAPEWAPARRSETSTPTPRIA